MQNKLRGGERKAETMHVDIIKLHVNMIMLRGQNYTTTHKKNTATGVISKLIDIQQE